MVARLGALVGEERYKLFDFPTADQVKIYYDNASLHVRLHDGSAAYERVARRPLFYDANALHRNSLKGWRWFSDAFSLLLALLAGTGLFVLRGRQGVGGRGKWLVLAGALPPVAALVLFRLA